MADGATIGEMEARAAVLAAVQQSMATGRWAEAAGLLARLGDLSGAESFQLNVSRNQAAMQRCRPAVYRALVEAREAGRYSVGVAKTGHPTIFFQPEQGEPQSMSPGNEPVAALSTVFAAIKKQYQAGNPMAMLGVGDGYLVKSCAMHAPKVAFDRQQAVYLFEPDAQAVLACMTIHDYSGEAGPIEQERFQWFIGQGYVEAARECLLGDLFNATPVFEVSQSPKAAAMGAALRRLLEEVFADYQRARAGVWAHYATVSGEEMAAVFSEAPARKPRVLLITTRKSSVLQYSTRDAAEGFREIGWEPVVFIEPKAHQVVTASKLMAVLEEFKPDLVFQIDHLRSEWRDAYPPQLPFGCWVQDHLPNLTNRDAGAAVGVRDYVLTAMPAMYVERYGYPRRQCVDLSKLTRVPKRPASWVSDGDDLAYVSSASEAPAEMLGQIAPRYAAEPALRQLVMAAGGRMLEVYQGGGALPTPRAVSDLLAAVEAETEIRITHAELRQEVVDVLFDRLSNLLYRQQGLRWAAGIARRLGLTLSVYGPGWERHEEFREFARGKVQYGEDLEALTRRSRINLVLEPFFSVSHQRLLDGLVAGGFLLVREHPSNTLFQELLNFLTAHRQTAGVSSVEEVRAVLRGEVLARFNELMGRCECLTGFGDLVDLVGGAERSGMLLAREWALPHLGDVSFGSEAEMEQRVVGHLADVGQRRRVAETQRMDVEGRLSYAAGMTRVVKQIGALIAGEDLLESATSAKAA